MAPHASNVSLIKTCLRNVQLFKKKLYGFTLEEKK